MVACFVVLSILFGACASKPPAPSTTDDPDAQTAAEDEKQAEKTKERRQRRRVLLKTAYDDRTIGQEQTAIVEAEMGIYNDEKLERYIHSVAVRLLRHAPPQPFDYEFKIVDQAVPNAFALPGGKIYLSRGLLALVGSEDELAAVIGHEITHAAERHAAARVEHASRINPFAIGILRAAAIAAYGREHERDADRGGQILAASAGYDPNGIATFLRKLDAADRYEVGWSRLPSFLATHPTSPERSAIASQRASELSWERMASVANEATAGRGYIGTIDGLVLGPDPAGGLFTEGRFVHPDMRFSLRFPKGWATQNTPQAVIGVAPDRDAEASLTAIGAAGDLDKAVDEFFAQEVNGVDFKILERKSIKLGELPGLRVVGRGRGLHAEMAFVEHEDLVFRLSVLSTSGAERKYRGRANSFLQSFRPLDQQGVYSLEVTRLRIARALEGETLQQLSIRTHNVLELVYTGVLNNLFASSELTQGQPIKIGLNEPYFPLPGEPAKEKSADGAPEDETVEPTPPDEAG
jgi:predicted Zn-dependent protease